MTHTANHRSFSAMPFRDPFTFSLLQSISFLSITICANGILYIACASSTQSGSLVVKNVAFSTFKRSTGHRSSSESNRNEKMRSSHSDRDLATLLSTVDKSANFYKRPARDRSTVEASRYFHQSQSS